MTDFKEEISGYLNNAQIIEALLDLDLMNGVEIIAENMRVCYNELIRLGFVGEQESILLNAWLKDLSSII
jgi:hypothetical protein